MKELSIEEKATRYDQSIKVAKSKIKNDKDHVLYEDDIIDIFHELKESEDENVDEKIRKALIKLVTNHASMDLFIEYGIHLDEALAWLEKQGEKTEPIEGFNTEFERQISHFIASTINKEYEYTKDFVKWASDAFLNYAKHELEKRSEQKPTDKVEPKFKVGDWVVFNNKHQSIYQVEKIEDGYYILRHTHGGTFRVCVLHDESLRLWTIQDAKDGDVLAYRDGQWIFIYKGIVAENNFKYYALLSEKGITVNDAAFSFFTSCIFPATKEQRDLLFQKMKEACYEWDAGKKELKKIVAPIFHIGDRVRYKGHACDGIITEITDTDYICGDAKLPISTQDKLELVEQRSAWNEEDEKMLNIILNDINYAQKNFSDSKLIPYDRKVNWFKSLKKRYTWKPSDEQMGVIEAVINNRSF